MSIKSQLSADQWKLLLNAPGAASVYVSTASGGGFEMIKEVISAGKFAQELGEKTGGSGYGELVDELLAAIKTMTSKDATAESIKYTANDPAGIRAEAKQFVVDGVAAVAGMPGVEGYKKWILDLARAVAETKTGGFLGIGAKAVIDEKEQAALDELAAVLGL